MHARTNVFTGFASDSLINGETVALRHTVCKSKADDGGGGEAAEAAEAVAEEEWRRKLGAAPSAPVFRAAAPRSNCVRRKKGVLTWRVGHACSVREKCAVSHPVHFPSRGSVSSAQWLRAQSDYGRVVSATGQGPTRRVARCTRQARVA